MRKKILAIFSIVIALLATFSALTLINAAPRRVGEVYTIDNAASGNNVLRFDRAGNGALSASGTFSTMGLGTGAGLGSQGAVALSEDGNYLIVVDAGSNEITVFQTKANTLTLTDKESSHGIAPISITINDNLVYVLNAGTETTPGNIAGFWLSKTGILTFISGSVQPLSGPANTAPEQIGFNPQGNVLVVTEKAAGMIDTYTVNRNGVASAPLITPANSAGPYGFAFNDDGFLVVSEAAANTMSSYAINYDGSLRTISGSMPTFGNAPCWVAITDNGKIAYTTNAHGGTISAFAISNEGILTLTSSIAATTNIPALDLAFSAGSKFIYVLNGNSITGFQVFNDGSLSKVNTVSSLPASTTGLAAS
jgi:6-phosphogluconolactonase